MTQMRGCDPRSRRIGAMISLAGSVIVLAIYIVLGLPREFVYVPISMAVGGVLLLTRLWRASVPAVCWVQAAWLARQDIWHRGHNDPLFGTGLFLGAVMLIFGFIMFGITRRRTIGQE